MTAGLRAMADADDAAELARLRRELAEARAEVERARREAETWRGRAEEARRQIEQALEEASRPATAGRAPSDLAAPEDPERAVDQGGPV